MKNLKTQFYLNAGKLDGQKIRWILLIIGLGLLAIGAGAPAAPGQPGL